MRPCNPRDPCCTSDLCDYAERLVETYAAGEDLTPGDQAAEADRAADREQDQRDRAWGAA